MSEDFKQELIKHAIRIGSDLNLVQGPGGNISMKLDGIIQVKASGTQLSEAGIQNIFVPLSLTALNREEVLNRDDFRTSVIGSDASSNHLKPSIETNLHLLIPHNCVTHIHSLGSILLGFVDIDLFRIQIAESKHRIDRLEYARPGKDLAKSIVALPLSEIKILVLRNHGSIFVGDNFKEIETMIHDFEYFALKKIKELSMNESFPTWFEILDGGVLTPDEAVFLGERPFSLNFDDRDTSVIVGAKGILSIPKNFNLTQIQLVNFYINVAKMMNKRMSPNYLEAQEVQDLLNWNKEKLRMKMIK